jgi:hypothetical protein
MNDTITPAQAAALEAGSVLADSQLDDRDIDRFFDIQPISDDIFQRMKGISFPEHCTTKREELRLLRLLHRGFDGLIHIGELVCHQCVAEDLRSIFRELYRQNYPIEKILLIDCYGGDDEKSMADNNSSCFNFRTVAGKTELSNHATGRAVDINPLYNPYITDKGFTPLNAGEYVNRNRDFPHKIDEEDLCYRLFTAHGFEWGGHWNHAKDYQHFQRLED